MLDTKAQYEFQILILSLIIFNSEHITCTTLESNPEPQEGQSSQNLITKIQIRFYVLSSYYKSNAHARIFFNISC